jgi:hypothetical protein
LNLSRYVCTYWLNITKNWYMVMPHLLFKSKRISSYVFVETFLCILFGLILLVSMFDWVVQRSVVQNKMRNQESSLRNLTFLLSSIQEDLLYAKWGSNDFLPINNQTSSSLAFLTFDEISLIRYYQSGNEVGKDINMTTYNAITQKTIQTFEVKRHDLSNYYSLSIKIKDIYGYTINKTFTSKKRF